MLLHTSHALTTTYMCIMQDTVPVIVDQSNSCHDRCVLSIACAMCIKLPDVLISANESSCTMNVMRDVRVSIGHSRRSSVDRVTPHLKPPHPRSRWRD